MEDVLDAWDLYQWLSFKEDNPRWQISSYGDRVTIENGKYIIDAISMEVAIKAATRQIQFDNSRPRYHCGWY